MDGWCIWANELKEWKLENPESSVEYRWQGTFEQACKLKGTKRTYKEERPERESNFSIEKD